MNDTNIKISACLVVYNDAALLPRCLNSLAGVVDEIIIVNDGPIIDETAKIAEKYGARLIIAPRSGEAELIRNLSYTAAQGEWILQIDADEYLSDELRQALPSLINDNKVDAYEFIWPIYNGQKYLTNNWPYKRVLFRKAKMSFLGLTHYVVQVDGRVVRLPLVLEHKPRYNNFSYKIFKSKWIPWSRIQAVLYLKKFSEISRFQYVGNKWPINIMLRRLFPILITPFDALTVFIKTIVSARGKLSLIVFRIAFMLACLRVVTNWEIYKKKSILLKGLYRKGREVIRYYIAIFTYSFIWPLSKKAVYDDINYFEQRIYSQHGEDGIIKKIFDTIGTTNKFCVEFGVEDGRECNTRYLIEKRGWGFLHMDIDNYGLSTIKRERVTKDNINHLFTKYNVPKKFDLLSIDIDYNDYWVWQAIDGFYPRVVIIEYNASIRPDLSLVVPYKEDFSGDGTNFFGASLLALKNLGQKKGYSLIACESAGANAFFIRNEEIKNYFLIKDIESIYKSPQYGEKVNGHYKGHPASSQEMLEI